MQRKLQRKIAGHLAAVWLILSLLIGSIVYYMEMSQLDEWIATMALTESARFVEASHGTGDLFPMSREKMLSSLEEMTRHNFVVVELYDRDGVKYLEAFKPGSDAVEKKLNQHEHAAPKGTSIWYQKYRFSEGVFLQVIVPLNNNNGEHWGYFEGVYRMDDQILATVERKVGWSLAMVILITLVTTVALYPIFLALNRDIIRYSQNLFKANFEVLSVLGGAIAKRDSDTLLHNYRVALYSIFLAEKVKVPPNQITELVKGAFLHDVGKIAISDTILLKKGSLTHEEFAIMKTHVNHGVDIIKRSTWLTQAAEVVRYHHEKYDGSGYMEGLRGNAIPLNARIFAIVDVFDALTTKRSYKPVFTLDKTMAIMRNGSGTHFDPEILQAFFQIFAQLHSKYNAASGDVLERELSLLLARYF